MIAKDLTREYPKSYKQAAKGVPGLLLTPPTDVVVAAAAATTTTGAIAIIFVSRWYAHELRHGTGCLAALRRGGGGRRHTSRQPAAAQRERAARERVQQ